MARVRRLSLEIHRRWHDGPALLTAARGCFTYAGEDRATGNLYSAGEQDWPQLLAASGPALLAALRELFDVTFPLVAFQAYRDGSGCGWHADTPFGAQAILSLGVTRTFGIRPLSGGGEQWYRVAHGDLVFMPAGFQDSWEHCVPVEDAPGERVSLVFRTRAEEPHG